jgi:outer membrane immunogenic protein
MGHGGDMKKLMMTTLALIAFGAIAPAQAADMPVKAMPVKAPIVVPYSWTGLYVGGNVGYSWGKSNTDVAFYTYPGGVPLVPPAGSITSANTKLNGAIAGLQAGYNWQRDKLVFGIEGDIQWSGQKGSSDFLCAAFINGPPTCTPASTFVPPGVTGTALSLDQKLQWFGTLRGRIGVTPAPTWLVYLTGGLAVGGIKTDGTLTGLTPALVLVSATGSSTTTKAGWTIGAGVEGVISGPWTGKIEYLYVDYGTVNGTFVNAPALVQANFSSRITDNVLRIGLNRRF